MVNFFGVSIGLYRILICLTVHHRELRNVHQLWPRWSWTFDIPYNYEGRLDTCIPTEKRNQCRMRPHRFPHCCIYKSVGNFVSASVSFWRFWRYLGILELIQTPIWPHGETISSNPSPRINSWASADSSHFLMISQQFPYCLMVFKLSPASLFVHMNILLSYITIVHLCPRYIPILFSHSDARPHSALFLISRLDFSSGPTYASLVPCNSRCLRQSCCWATWHKWN